MAAKTTETATLTDGFEIEEGGSGTTTGAGAAGGFFCEISNIGTDQGLSKFINHPDAVRVNRIVPITIGFGNSGNVDIPTPARFIMSLKGAPLTFDPADFSEKKQELLLEFNETDGPPGILRPGALGVGNNLYFFVAPVVVFIVEMMRTVELQFDGPLSLIKGYLVKYNRRRTGVRRYKLK